jgi:hypothetical protein
MTHGMGRPSGGSPSSALGGSGSWPRARRKRPAVPTGEAMLAPPTADLLIPSVPPPGSANRTALPLAATLLILGLAYWCVDIVSPALPVVRESLGLNATAGWLGDVRLLRRPPAGEPPGRPAGRPGRTEDHGHGRRRRAGRGLDAGGDGRGRGAALASSGAPRLRGGAAGDRRVAVGAAGAPGRRCGDDRVQRLGRRRRQLRALRKRGADEPLRLAGCFLVQLLPWFGDAGGGALGASGSGAQTVRWMPRSTSQCSRRQAGPQRCSVRWPRIS